MHESDDEVFVSGEKQAVVQTMDFISLKTFNRQSSKFSRKSQEDVSWKFTALQTQHHHSTKSNIHKYTKNISFADQKWYSNNSSDRYDSDEEYESPFVERYRDCEEVYKKRVGFGTNWIGRKQYFASTFIDPTRIEKNNIQYYCPKSPLDPLDSVPPNSCLFDSQFESGNLMNVFKVAQLQYDLLLQNDINTKGNTQWFYFRIKNVPRQRNIKINIVNLRKPDSLFNYGLMPCLYSFEEAKRGGRGWIRGGKNICYFKNDHSIENSKRYYFTLSFQVSTSYDNDTLLIAHSFPYTPTDLNNFLDAQIKIKYKNQLLQRQTILNTIGKNKVEVLTITDNNSKVKSKPLIFIMARQHPGQTPSSFVCEGLIDYLLSRDKESEYLRKNYQIKIVPMVNPDGVVAGNYRTNLSGIDLNRRWDGGNRSKNMHQAAYIKKYFAQISKNREVSFILDLHGHSRKLFSFFYGNPNSSCPVQPRIFPLLCSKLGPNLIRFEDSTFTNEQFKRNTARIQLGLSYKTPNIFTYQVSFFGYIGKDKEKKHFTVEGLKQLGQILGKGIYTHERGKQLFGTLPQSKQITLYKKCITELRSNKTLISMGQRQNSGSESSPEQCEVKQNEQQKLQSNQDYNCSKPIPKVKIVKKLLKKQPQVKQVYKSSRQMQVLDIAQVNSAFPSNIIALIPNSYFNKYKKNPFVNCAVQTDDSPIIKIYQTCKQQELSTINPQSSSQFSHSDSPVPQEGLKKNTLIRSSILNRPKTSNITSESTDYMPLSMKSHRKKQDTQKRDNNPSKKATSLKKKSKIQQIGCQTTISFGISNFNHLNNIKLSLQREADILESKTIDPTFSSIQYSRGSLQYTKGNLNAKAVGLVISKNIFEHLKIRRKNGV